MIVLKGSQSERLAAPHKFQRQRGEILSKPTENSSIFGAAEPLSQAVLVQRLVEEPRPEMMPTVGEEAIPAEHALRRVNQIVQGRIDVETGMLRTQAEFLDDCLVLVATLVNLKPFLLKQSEKRPLFPGNQPEIRAGRP